MMLRQGQALLLPANPLFVWASLLIALAGNMLLNMGPLGRAAWSPDLLAVCLVFWTVHQPLRVGVVAAFVFGLMMDVHQGVLLGQHALAYTALGYLSVAIHRRLLWFPLASQAVQVLPVLLVAHAVALLVRLLTGGTLDVLAMAQSLLLAPLLEAALWPLANAVLLAPQRRAHDPDDNRPI